MEWLTPILSRLNEITIFFILCLGGLGYLYLNLLRESRAERKTLTDLLYKVGEALDQSRIAHAASLAEITKAISDLRVVLAARTGTTL